MRKSIIGLGLAAILLASLPLAMAQDSSHFGVSKPSVATQYHAVDVAVTPAIKAEVAVAMPAGSAIKSEAMAKSFDGFKPVSLKGDEYEAIYKDRKYTPLNL